MSLDDRPRNSALDRLCFFLGGADLEMETIAEFLSEHLPPSRIFNKRLSWGAGASAYADEIRAVASQGMVPVLVELASDIALPSGTILVDHHGQRAGHGAVTSLEQVFRLLRRPQHEWTRRFALVAANDRGHVRAMQQLGASIEEMRYVRAADRRAQGISPQQEEEAKQSMAGTTLLCGGELTVVRLPHAHTAAVADLLEPCLGGPGYKNLLICTPLDVTVYGTGAIIEALREAFPGGWWGGDLPERGYWGAKRSCREALAYLMRRLN